MYFANTPVSSNFMSNAEIRRAHSLNFIYEIFKILEISRVAQQVFKYIAPYFKQFENPDFVKPVQLFSCPVDPSDKRETFDSHGKFDTFVRDYVIKYAKKLKTLSLPYAMKMYMEDYPVEYALLRSFDREWWVKHKRRSHDIEYNSEDCAPKECVFGEVKQLKDKKPDDE